MLTSGVRLGPLATFQAGGTLWCWGYNVPRQLDDYTTSRTAPVQSGSPARSTGIDGGGTHTLVSAVADRPVDLVGGVNKHVDARQ